MKFLWGEGFPRWELSRMGAWGRVGMGSPLHRKRDSFEPWPCVMPCQCHRLPVSQRSLSNDAGWIAGCVVETGMMFTIYD